ncbi:MAG: hypothetical protein ABJF11_19410 [Reichenbachiella sp.]|uniref:hypothetical protein n=1 Tax=Reichenbachiella sp. TaxID=2184521 RepID=UPI0032650E0F
MRLYTCCIDCRRDISFYENAKDRYALAIIRGQSFELICENCDKLSYYHVNQIRMDQNKAITLGILSLLIGCAMGLIYYFWPQLTRAPIVLVIWGLIGMLGVLFLIYQEITTKHKSQVVYFNRRIYR